MRQKVEETPRFERKHAWRLVEAVPSGPSILLRPRAVLPRVAVGCPRIPSECAYTRIVGV